MGVCGPLPKTLTLFITKICDIPYPVYDLTKNSKPKESNPPQADLGEGPRGPRPPLFFWYFQNVLRFCFENRFIKCSFILSSETLTLLYFASRIRHNAVSCIFWKVKFSYGGVGEIQPPLSEFSGSARSGLSPTSFPGSLFSSSLGRWKRDPGNEVGLSPSHLIAPSKSKMLQS